MSSSASRTALASSAGGRSQAYSLVAGRVVLAVLLFLSPLLAPHARRPCSARLVVYAAVRHDRPGGFRRLAAFRRRELLLALGCLAGVLALDILYGVLVAVGLSVAELLTAARCGTCGPWRCTTCSAWPPTAARRPRPRGGPGGLPRLRPAPPRLVALAHDFARFWLMSGRFDEALQLFRAVLPHFTRLHERRLITANMARGGGGDGRPADLRRDVVGDVAAGG